MMQNSNCLNFLKSIVAGVVISCGMAACTDTIVEEDNTIADSTSENAIWHSPEVLTRAQTLQKFIYDHAVGYSYNAITGDDYSIKDVRCQIINRAELDRLADVSKYFLYEINQEQKSSESGDVYTSMTKYVQNVNLKAEGNASIILIAGGTAKAECSIFEDGTTDCYVVNSKKKISCGTYRIYADAIMSLAKTSPMVLTASFRDAVRQVAAAPENDYKACVDSFVKTYGTHVVTYAEVGGRLNVMLQVEQKKFKTQYNLEGKLSADVLKGMFKASAEASGSKDDYERLVNTRCKITVAGGSVKYLDKLTSMDTYQLNTCDEADLNKWQSSVVFDPDNSSKDSTTVIDMKFTPIYEFVTDEVAKGRICNAISGSVQALIDQLGNRNLVNVSFPYQTSTLNYTLGGKQLTTNDAKNMNMVYAGRHVATICTERIEAIDASQDVRVVYPIYEGRIQLSNGFCVHNGNAYNVAWVGDECKVTDKGTADANSTIYITGGAPSMLKYDNITYGQAHAVPDIETNMPIKVDGSYNTQAASYFVEKVKGHFFLPATKGQGALTGIPNWTYDESTGMMKRNDDYVYVYNPNEMSYND